MMHTSLKDESTGSFDLNNIDFISVMDRLDEGVIIAHNEGIIRYYNETQCKIDDLDFNYVVGKKVIEISRLLPQLISLGELLFRTTSWRMDLYYRIRVVLVMIQPSATGC